VWTFDQANKGTSVACGDVIFNAGDTFDAEINEFSSVVGIRELKERFVVFVHCKSGSVATTPKSV
jgi:hypothetical protein